MQVSHSSVSGVFVFEGELLELNANTTSGRIFLKNMIIAEKLDLDTTSGDVRLIIPKFDEISIKYNTISGKFNCDIPVLIGKSANSYSISTGSGDITIEELK